MFRKENVTDDFRLLLEPVAPKRTLGLKPIVIAAEWMAHQRQVETAALLRLPDMGQLVDEISLLSNWLFGEIVRPAAAVWMEVDVPHRCHGGASGLERPPFAFDQPDPRIIDRI